MNRIVLLICSLLCTLALTGQNARALYPGLQGEALLQAIQAAYTPQRLLGYGEARDVMYGKIDNLRDSVTGFYTGYRLYLPPGEDPSQSLYRDGSADGINCEHVWPRSKGAKSGNPKSDMHHLFPTRVAVNAARGNSPFAEIPDEQSEYWYAATTELRSVPAEDIDAFSESTGELFEPRESVKGDVARAMFYFYTIYRREALQADPLFFQQQRATLLLWNRLDPPSPQELSRTQAIARYQDGIPNPFVLDPTLADRLYGF